MELVTGATGHIGNVLVRELGAQGRAVRALVLPKENTRSLAGLPIEIVEGNVLDMDSLRCAMQDVTCVYHLAGMITIMPGKNEQVRRVNVEGTRNIIQLMRELQIRRLVYTSSIHALKRVPQGILMDENLPFDPDNPVGAYDRSKAEASLLIQQAVRDGLDAVLVCPTGVIGPHDYLGSEMGVLIHSWMDSGVRFLIKARMILWMSVTWRMALCWLANAEKRGRFIFSPVRKFTWNGCRYWCVRRLVCSPRLF
jgi:dihydroflavonol-4-reductase